MTGMSLAGYRDRIKIAVSQWLATPTEYRSTSNLSELADSLGLEDTAELYAAGAGDADYNQALLQASVSYVMPKIPDVLAGLVTAAERGSVRAAEILLGHVRQTVQNHPTQAQGPTHVTYQAILQGLPESVNALASLATALGDNPEQANQKLRDWRTEQALKDRTAVVGKEVITSTKVVAIPKEDTTE